MNIHCESQFSCMDFLAKNLKWICRATKCTYTYVLMKSKHIDAMVRSWLRRCDVIPPYVSLRRTVLRHYQGAPSLPYGLTSLPRCYVITTTLRHKDCVTLLSGYNLITTVRRYRHRGTSLSQHDVITTEWRHYHNMTVHTMLWCHNHSMTSSPRCGVIATAWYHYGVTLITALRHHHGEM